MSCGANRFSLLGQWQNTSHVTQTHIRSFLCDTSGGNDRHWHITPWIIIYVRMSIQVQFECLACRCFLYSHALSSQCQSSPVQWKTERKTLSPPPHCEPTWRVIADFVIGFLSLFSHDLITTQTVGRDDPEYYHEGPLLWLHLKIGSTQSFLIFFFYFFPHSALMSLPSLFIPHLCLLQPPLSLPLSTFLGEWVESSMGMWDPRRAVGVCLLPEHSMCAKWGLLIGQADQSAVEVGCLASFEGTKHLPNSCFKKFSVFRTRLCALWSCKRQFVVTFLYLNLESLNFCGSPSLPFHCSSPP